MTLPCPQQRAWKFGGPRGSHNCHEIHSWMVFVAYRVKWRALELGMTYAPTAIAAWRKKDQWRDRIVAVGISFTILVGCPTRFTHIYTLPHKIMGQWRMTMKTSNWSTLFKSAIFYGTMIVGQSNGCFNIRNSPQKDSLSCCSLTVSFHFGDFSGDPKFEVSTYPKILRCHQGLSARSEFSWIWGHNIAYNVNTSTQRNASVIRRVACLTQNQSYCNAQEQT